MFGETPFDVIDATPGTAVLRLGRRSATLPATAADHGKVVEVWFADPDTLLLRERGQREAVEVRVRAR
jgi:hypothetical protein